MIPAWLIPLVIAFASAVGAVAGIRYTAMSAKAQGEKLEIALNSLIKSMTTLESEVRHLGAIVTETREDMDKLRESLTTVEKDVIRIQYQ